jgi:hypothetical protein
MSLGGLVGAIYGPLEYVLCARWVGWIDRELTFPYSDSPMRLVERDYG